MRLVAPLTSALTDCRFGSNRRGPTLWAWEMVRPTTGPLPQISHRLAISSSRDAHGRAPRPPAQTPYCSGRSGNDQRTGLVGGGWRGRATTLEQARDQGQIRVISRLL